MSDLSGEDLLKVFKDVNIQLLNLNPNAIMGWFDTDDKNMKNLLTWMCTSLSSSNYVSPLENSEFCEVQSSLSGEKYDEEVVLLEAKYPDIFEVDSSVLDVEIIENEIDLTLEEDQHSDDLIFMNEYLEKSLSKELNEKTSMEIKTSLRLNAAQEQCNKLAEKLDQINLKLHKQLIRYGENLYNFEFSPDFNFINNMDIEICQEKFNSLKSLLTPMLEDPFSSSNVTNRSFLGSTLNETLEDKLGNMRDRILHSKQHYTISKIEMEKVKECMNYLIKTDNNSVTSLTESIIWNHNMETKEETRRRMCSMLEKISSKLADQQISLTKLKYTQQELERYQTKLDNLSDIEDTILKILSQYFMMSMLYIQENKDIDNSDEFFRNMIRYISGDLQNSIYQMDKMNDIIEVYNAESMEKKFHFIKSVVTILHNGEDFSLSRAFETLADFKNELNRMEAKLFSCNMDYRSLAGNLKSNIKILQSFLICGPTHRIVVVPYELHKIIRETEENLKQQLASVKTAVEITTSMKKRFKKKWQNYRRQLWMYFYSEPHKLKFLMNQIEEEFKNLKVNNEEHQ